MYVCVAKLSLSENNNNREFLRLRERDTAAGTKSYKEVYTHTHIQRESIYGCHIGGASTKTTRVTQAGPTLRNITRRESNPVPYSPHTYIHTY